MLPIGMAHETKEAITKRLLQRNRTNTLEIGIQVLQLSYAKQLLSLKLNLS